MPRTSRALGLFTLFASPIALLLPAGVTSCSSSGSATPADAGHESSVFCVPPDDVSKDVRFIPSQLVLAPGASAEVRVLIEPDVCQPTPVPITVDDASVATLGGGFTADETHAETKIKITAGSAGTATATATFGARTAKLAIDVRAPDAVACAPKQSGTAKHGATVKATNGAAFTLPVAGPQAGDSVVADFPIDVTCADAAAPTGTVALGPAITFAPVEKRFLREPIFELPINPARMPTTAKLHHLQVLYSSASIKTPRAIPVANPAIAKSGDQWVFRFEAPRLGTYQVVVPTDAGTKTYKRKLTHRAVFGFSMGGIGASMVGMNHHDLFDVVAPLGGPMDPTWLLWYVKKYHMGGFCERAAGDPIPTTPCHADVGKPTELFEHVQDFEHWWHMDGVDGTGGTFPRSEYVEIFRDLSIQWGDPASRNDAFPYVANGVTSPLSVRADTADYCGDPAKATVAATGYYDAQYNPDGSLPVIKFCDGAAAPGKPCQWVPGGQKPMEIALAVDLNKNGKRDEGEPVIAQGYEPFDDFGLDGKASKDEPGYDPVTNPDPSGDDYDNQYNPLGTEGNHHFDKSADGTKTEPFKDVGLDGVVCPTGKTCSFDFGEGNGKWDQSPGLEHFQKVDGRSQILGWTGAPVGGAWSDAALDSLDYYSDGGIRDIFNWGVIGQHYAGAFPARGRSLMYFNDWTHFPNAVINDSTYFDPKNVDYEALGQNAFVRYGSLDATDKLIASGDGQHVGYVDQLYRRVQSALFFIGAKWPDADRAYVEDPEPPATPDPEPCKDTLSCTYDFTDHNGRKGPTLVVLPPGYHADAAKGVTYPVVYFLHGYGQTPEDLQATILLISPFMGSGLSSRATRLPKMIMVFVDGRCRTKADGSPECVNGTFYKNSPTVGPQIDDYFMDLMKDVDKRFRTMGPSEVEVTR
jgi:hypothetical protein